MFMGHSEMPESEALYLFIALSHHILNSEDPGDTEISYFNNFLLLGVECDIFQL
jgi:hypothetical protein